MSSITVTQINDHQTMYEPNQMELNNTSDQDSSSLSSTETVESHGLTREPWDSYEKTAEEPWPERTTESMNASNIDPQLMNGPYQDSLATSRASGLRAEVVTLTVWTDPSGSGLLNKGPETVLTDITSNVVSAEVDTKYAQVSYFKLVEVLANFRQCFDFAIKMNRIEGVTDSNCEYMNAIEQARRPFQKKLLELDNIVETALGSENWTHVKTKNLKSAGWKQTLAEMKEMWQERLDEVETQAE